MCKKKKKKDIRQRFEHIEQWHWKQRIKCKCQTYWLIKWMMFSSVFSLSFSIIFPRNEKWWTMVKFKAIENTSLLHLRIFHTLSMLFLPLSSQPSTNHTERKLDGMCFFGLFFSLSLLHNFVYLKWRSEIILATKFNLVVSFRFVSFRFFCLLFVIFFSVIVSLFKLSNQLVLLHWCAEWIKFENRNLVSKKSDTKWKINSFTTYIL